MTVTSVIVAPMSADQLDDDGDSSQGNVLVCQDRRTRPTHSKKEHFASPQIHNVEISTADRLF